MTAEGPEGKGGTALRRLIVAGVIIALAVWFVLANTETVGVKLWLVKVETPMWIMITVVFLAGWAVGALLRRRSAKRRG
ncbi:lipopolysaccharide assembly protein LapA domain-containing protein [Glycomyces paridis]|uniref:lipopolysaccharide assembly protein LapA domain-containing protein n=1 Tax=Glycomyces paridis TaxID=2126555 RepID=UPI00130539A9|nr:lipopolysaccharide assembly protein LapA domain-containing protein [Glycomyces paridis]